MRGAGPTRRAARADFTGAVWAASATGVDIAAAVASIRKPGRNLNIDWELVSVGVGVSVGVSVMVGVFYLFYKLAFWNSFSVGMAPLVIGIFFFISVQLVSLGIIGEYVGSIQTMVQNRPLVIERERINFELPSAPAGSSVVAGLVNLQEAVRQPQPEHVR